ncbi:hypothetical protein GGI20_003161 [Coemansia sp. BCRC 34301]|nr:hypothetical protein GGI20_003161 [Coemansia sp. BCRC 34301]
MALRTVISGYDSGSVNSCHHVCCGVLQGSVELIGVVGGDGANSTSASPYVRIFVDMANDRSGVVTLGPPYPRGPALEEPAPTPDAATDNFVREALGLASEVVFLTASSTVIALSINRVP